MSPAGFRPWRCVAALLTLPVIAAAQDAAPAASATLPQSHEALLLANRVEDALAAGEHRLAIELALRILESDGGLVPLPATRTFYPARRQAARLLAGFPPDAVRVYRQLYDAGVEAELEEAVARSDVPALRSLFHKHRISAHWRRIGVELAARLLDEGQFAEAARTLLALQDGLGEPAGDVALQHVAALGGAGATRSAMRLADELERSGLLTPRQAERLGSVRTWVERLREEASDFAPRVDTATARCTLPRVPGQESLYTDGSVADAVVRHQQLPRYGALLADDTLLVRFQEQVWAVDTLSLTVRWHTGSTPVSWVEQMETRPGDDGFRDVHPGVRAALAGHVEHCLSFGFDAVYTIEATSPRSPLEAHMAPNLRLASDGPRRNELVAREIDTGRVRWRTAEDPTHALFDATFLDRPLASGDALVVPVLLADELRLARLSPDDGAVIENVLVAGQPLHLSPPDGRCQVTADDTSLYISTGNGVVVALDRTDFSWRWATQYASTLSERLGRLWWQAGRPATEFAPQRPVVVDDLLVVAPVDSRAEQILALDRFSGLRRWTLSRREVRFLVGAVDAGLVVGSHVLSCLDLEDPLGKPPIWKTVPLEITGRPAIRGERILVPTRRGLVVVDGRTGRIVDEQAGPDDEIDRSFRFAMMQPDSPSRATVLVTSRNAVYSVSPAEVQVFADAGRTRARLDAMRDDAADPLRIALATAQLDLAVGDVDNVLAALEPEPGPDAPEAQRVRRGELLLDAAIRKAGSAASIEGRLEWLERAAAYADARPGTRAWIAYLAGAALQDAGRPGDAVRRYWYALGWSDDPAPPTDATGARYVAPWLRAAGALRAAAADASADTIPDLVRQALSEEDPDTAHGRTALQRLYAALGNRPERAPLSLALARSDLAPELAVQYVSDVDESRLSLEERAELHLTRWRLFATLGRFPEVEEAARRWRDEFATLLEPRQLPDAATRVDEIETVTRKLRSLEAAPFGEQFWRQWRLRQAELVLDTESAATPAGPWILARHYGEQTVELLDSVRNQQPWRRHDDGLSEGRLGALAAYESQQAALWNQRTSFDSGPRTVWPAAVWRELAIVPVPRGIVCIGLGTGPGAGERLWEFALPQWESIPPDFNRRCAVGADGVSLLTRPDHVLHLGWSSGDVRWSRTFDDSGLTRIERAGSQLLFFGEDAVWSCEARSGTDVVTLRPGPSSLRGAALFERTLVVWQEGSVVGLDLATHDVRWQQQIDVQPRGVAVGDANVLLLAERANDAWLALDAEDGSRLEAQLDGVGQISAAVLDRDRDAFLVAGILATLDGVPEVRVAAIDRSTGRQRWRYEALTRVPVNPSQLTGHDQFVPLLLDLSESGGGGKPAIELISKDTGDRVSRKEIADDLQPQANAVCDLYLLATPARMIVQAGGMLVGYGQSQ